MEKKYIELNSVKDTQIFAIKSHQERGSLQNITGGLKFVKEKIQLNLIE